MSRLWVNSAVAGWTAKFFPVAKALMEVNEEQSLGGRQSGANRKKAVRNNAIREYIRARIDSGESYNSAINSVAAPKNWRAEWGECPSERTLRNTFPKKTFP